MSVIIWILWFFQVKRRLSTKNSRQRWGQGGVQKRSKCLPLSLTFFIQTAYMSDPNNINRLGHILNKKPCRFTLGGTRIHRAIWNSNLAHRHSNSKIWQNLKKGRRVARDSKRDKTCVNTPQVSSCQTKNLRLSRQALPRVFHCATKVKIGEPSNCGIGSDPSLI